MGMEDIEGEGRTMIGLPAIKTVTFNEATGRDPKPDEIIVMGDGTQYAKLPEGWPAADPKELAEAHATAVLADDWGNPYSDWSPEDIRDFVEEYAMLLRDHVLALAELHALRKGMKTMQRKQRKQTQVIRRLERRLAQARAARDRARENVSFYVKTSLKRGLAELGEPQANTPEVK